MYDFVSTQEVGHPVRTVCSTLGISRSSYYEYRKQKTYRVNQRELESVQRIFAVHRRGYKSRRISKALGHQGIKNGPVQGAKVNERWGSESDRTQEFCAQDYQ